MNRRKFIKMTSAASIGAGILGRPDRYALGANVSDSQMRYIAPEARNDGTGIDPENAAMWTDDAFWSQIESLLYNNDVIVNFTDGIYQVSDRNQMNMPLFSLDLGHNNHFLTLQGMSPDDVKIMRHPEDDIGDYHETGLMILSYCRNITLRNLNFTSPLGHRIGYATLFSRCQNILIDSCTWIDMPNVYYGATGAHRQESHHIVFSSCRFIRVGYDSHAHMAYNAYNARGTHYFNCQFEDSPGDYVRYRSGSDYGIITGCTFRSTGNYTNTHMPFISIPVFNIEGGSEIFGTHFMFFNNSFIYETSEKSSTRIAIVIHHSGYDPPNRRHLLDPEEAEILASGSTDQKKGLLKANLGIDTEKFYVYNNSFENVAYRGAYRCWALYGAESRGGDGTHNIFDAFNNQPVADSPEEALDYWQESGVYSGPVFGPEVIYPLPSAVNVPLQPTFKWQEVPYASNYKFQLTSTNFLQENILLDTNVTGNELPLPFELEGMEKYRWKVRGLNENMEGPWSVESTFKTQRNTSTGAKEGIPSEFKLHGNYPNPFNPSTQIRFDIAEYSHVRLAVYNLIGQELAILINENRAPGKYTIPFDASGLSGGLLIYRIKAGAFETSRSMLFLK